jgi:hypothetical protein
MESKSKHVAEWITAACTAAMALTAIVALLYAHWQLKQDRDEAEVGRMLEEVHKYDEEPMVSYRRTYAERRLKGVEDPSEEYQLMDFFETIGLLVDRGYLDETDVWENFSGYLLPLYTDTRDDVEEGQKNDPTYYEHYKTLAERLTRLEKTHHGNELPETKDDLKEFWQQESELVPGQPPAHKHAKAAK